MTTDAENHDESPALRRAGLPSAAIVYAVLVLTTMSGVLGTPKASILTNTAIGRAGANLARLDQQMVIFKVSENAERLVHAPSDLFGDGQCFPLPNAYTFGEHMIGTSVLAALPLALSGEPILAFNAALALCLWLPGMTMFLLARYFTGSTPAALVAGALFMLQPHRIIDAGHPFVHADFWTPLIFLGLHRCFTGGTWRAVAGLAAAATLQTLESLYPLAGCVFLCAIYGLSLLVRLPDRAPSALPRIALAAVAPIGLALLLFPPYLETSAIWNVHEGRAGMFLPTIVFQPGYFAFPGWVLVALAAVGIVDRWRGENHGTRPDPRLPLLCGSLLLLWGAVQPLSVPGTELTLPNPFAVASRFIPGLDAIRAVSATSYPAWMSISLLGGFGVARLLRGRSGALQLGAVAIVLVLLAAERFHPALAHANFGGPLALDGVSIRPYQDDIDLVRAAGREPSIDAPYGGVQLQRMGQSDYLLLRAFAPAPTGACYNSFLSPLETEITGLIRELPTPQAMEELAAIGFRTLFVHPGRMWRPDFQRFEAQMETLDTIGLAPAEIGRTPRIRAYRLTAPEPPPRRDFSSLGPTRPGPPTPLVAGTRARLAFPVANITDAPYAHPDPIQPTPLRVVWQRHGSAEPALRIDTDGVLPLALSVARRRDVTLSLDVPSTPGRFTVRVFLPTHSRVLTAIEVEVLPDAADVSPSERPGRDEGQA